MRLLLVGLSFMFCCQWAVAQEGFKVGYKEGGGGIFIESPDENIRFSILGYVQATQKGYASSEYDKTAADYPLSFGVRRARVDFAATVYKDHELFIEFDGAPTTSVGNPANPSGFALVEARVTSKLMGDALMVRFGKFVSPFSTEGARSSRAYDTVERYMVLNSMYGLPALDTQYGAMLFGKAKEGTFQWYLMAANGNGKASNNTGENNASKEYVAKVVYQPSSNASVGLGYDWSKEPAQTVTLSDLAGSKFAALPVSGERNGVTGDVYYASGRFSARSEYMHMNWKQVDTKLSGGFLQFAYFVTGDEKAGFQPLLRAEVAKLEGPANTPVAKQLTAVTAGWQWFINPNVRNQFNFISTISDKDGGDPAGAYADKATRYAVLNQVQIKF